MNHRPQTRNHKPETTNSPSPPSLLTAAGLQKTSLIDFPGKVSCVIFFTGCNFSCPYCHNPALARGQYPQRIRQAELSTFMEQRRGFLDGVVISGGEPCLNRHLPEFCRSVKKLGLAVKLDTNGSRPRMLKTLIEAGLVDYIAMDLKTAPANYGPPWCPEGTDAMIAQSIDIIMTCGVAYEFRTTCVAPFVNERLIEQMAQSVKTAERYILQNLNPQVMLAPQYFPAAPKPMPMETMTALQRIVTPLVKECKIR